MCWVCNVAIRRMYVTYPAHPCLGAPGFSFHLRRSTSGSEFILSMVLHSSQYLKEWTQSSTQATIYLHWHHHWPHPSASSPSLSQRLPSFLPFLVSFVLYCLSQRIFCSHSWFLSALSQVFHQMPTGTTEQLSTLAGPRTLPIAALRGMLRASKSLLTTSWMFYSHIFFSLQFFPSIQFHWLAAHSWFRHSLFIQSNQLVQPPLSLPWFQFSPTIDVLSS